MAYSELQQLSDGEFKRLCGVSRSTYGNRTSPKKQKRYYSGKQKCHRLKAQLLVEFETGQIICTAVDTGRTHDFKLLKRSRLPFVASQLCLADRRRGSSRVC